MYRGIDEQTELARQLEPLYWDVVFGEWAGLAHSTITRVAIRPVGGWWCRGVVHNQKGGPCECVTLETCLQLPVSGVIAADGGLEGNVSGRDSPP